MSDIKEWHNRLVEERQQLFDRLSKLTQFIFESEFFCELDPTTQALLRKQRGIMLDYLNILDERVRLCRLAHQVSQV